MKYYLKFDSRFVCGVTCFGMKAGAEVSVKQEDKSTRKVLIDFGGGMVDWFDKSMLKNFEAFDQEK